MAVKQCPECGRNNPDSRYFCAKCGTMLDKESFSNPKRCKTPEFKIARILDNLNHAPHTEIVWDDTIDLYTQKAERYCAMLGLPEFQNKSAEDLRVQLLAFLEMCRRPEFQIAFVGTIKTGKSTLINALLGHNYASMDVTPETAALTKFRSSPKDYVRVTFYSEQEWNDLEKTISSGADEYRRKYQELNAEDGRAKWVGHEPLHKELPNNGIEDELRIWSTANSAAHFFVKEVEVGLSNLPADIPPQVVFVDTPGLSDPVAYRSDISKQYIRRANAVFVCVEAQKLMKDEIETISSVFSFSSYNKSKVHIIATKWDKLNDIRSDWDKLKAAMVEQLTGKSFFDTNEMAEKNIVHSASYIYNLCNEYDENPDFNREQPKKARSLRHFMEDIDVLSGEVKDNLSTIRRATNIENIRTILVNELASQYRELLSRDIKNKYDDICFKLKRFADEGYRTQHERIQMTELDMDGMRQKVEEQRKARDELNSSREQLEKVVKTVDKRTQERLGKVLDLFRSQIDKQGK